MGAQILYDSSYDPRGMVHFFEKLQTQNSGRAVEFFSSHPNPGNRIGTVSQEIQRLGGARGFTNDSADFQRIKRVFK